MKQTATILALTSFLFFAPQLIMENRADAAGTTATLKKDGTWTNDGIWMDEPENYVGKAPAPMDYYRSAIQFELPDLQGKTVTKATLRIKIANIQSSYPSLTPFLTVYGSSVDTWGVDFPLAVTDEEIKTIEVAGTDAGNWLEFDVTDFVVKQTDGIASFALRANEQFGGAGDELDIIYYADDSLYSAYHPQLILETGTPTLASKPPVVANATTSEDTPVSGLVINKDPQDETAVTHFKISNITGGRLYQQDGMTEITNGTFISTNEGSNGLNFVPSANANFPAGDTFSFQAQAAQSGSGNGLSTVAEPLIMVTEVNDPPVAGDDALGDIKEDASPLIIPIADLLANDSPGPANEAGQALKLTMEPNNSVTGGELSIDGANLVFTPKPNYWGNAGFTYTITDNGTTNGLPSPETAEGTVAFYIQPVADIPNVTDATTAEDTQTSDGLQISKNEVDGPEVTYYKVSNIRGGTLFKNDGVTPILDGEFTPASEGAKGLKFTPGPDSNTQAGDIFSFQVQAALDLGGTGLSDSATATITVNEVNDRPVAEPDTLEPIAENSGERMIPISKLTENDKTGPSNESDQIPTVIAVEEITGGAVRLDVDTQQVIFTPSLNFRGEASFRYTVQDDFGLTSSAIVTFQIMARTDPPNVSPAETPEDTMTGDGLVITKTDVGGSTTTHFKISGITGGKLYHSNGSTKIEDGEFITVSEGGAGLRFKPADDQHGDSGFGFVVQAAADANGSLLSDAVTATIRVTEVNDTPVGLDDELGNFEKGSTLISIPLSKLIENDIPGPPDEHWQTLNVIDVTPMVGDTATLDQDHITYRLNPSHSETVTFSYTVIDDGITNNISDPKTVTAKAIFHLTDSTPPIITLNGDQTLYVLQNESYAEPGYSANDEIDGDLTDEVVAEGEVDTHVLGIYTIRYNVKDGSGNDAAEVTRTVHVVSNKLGDLSVSSYQLTPSFDPDQNSYSLESNDKTVTIEATTLDTTATLTINGFVKGNGGQQAVNLENGKNEITIVVTAKGGATQPYELEITFLPPVTPDPGPEPDPQPNPDPGPEPDPQPNPDPGPEPDPQPNPDPGPEPDPQPNPDPGPEPDPQPNPDPGPEPDPQPNPDPGPEPDPQPNPDPGPEPDPQPNPDPGPEPDPQPNPDPKPTPTPRPDRDRNRDSKSGNNQDTKKETRQARVISDDQRDKAAVKVDIERSIERNGKIIDSVSLSGAKVEELLSGNKANSMKFARIEVDEIKDQPAEEVLINVSGSALHKLNEARLDLIIEVSGAKITLSQDTLNQFNDNQNLYFRVVPIHKNDESLQVKEKVNGAQEVQAFANGRNVRAVGQPMTIETNYTHHKTKVSFPLEGIDISDDPQQRQSFLDGLAVFIEHSDRDKEVKTGKIEYDESGHPIGIEIEVQMFSTFTIISTESDFKSYKRYISGFPDGAFHPSDNITRAELASLIARHMGLVQDKGANPYPDLHATHWAANSVLQLSAAGILSGDLTGYFRPEQGVTRAEMASVAYKVKGLEPAKLENTFSDTQGHWASNIIEAVQKAGLMRGYEDGTFRPNQRLTRAEAITILNRLFARPALSIMQGTHWSDVAQSHWAAGDIESASRDLRLYQDGRIEFADLHE
ncbi:S-layer homology domain-containing protein [Brevibacillus choshinensis]|uniref:S-layer homology domain-containing protein n=1 Tax=Brevibacillus choshinensis TaxID=54911 RepID=A0ABX7FSB0_BRECH|nr:Ig-like domain-containing protein [Brevibacillus choshinensis]QRG68618.1 S-layer homology domain-containing protein [Brevibacillus choshinensis]